MDRKTKKNLFKVLAEPQMDDWEGLCKRPVSDLEDVEKIVRPILEKVKRNGDRALLKFALEYDHVDLDSIMVTPDRLAEAAQHVPEELKTAIQVAYENIEKFHVAQHVAPLHVSTMDGVDCSRKSVPISKVGLYIPGGTAPLFSTVLMLGIPAKLAGCKEIVISTPTDSTGQINPIILYTANLLGIDKIIKLGGAQAIAAMAFGTETVPKVDKIFGPGNQYVTVAKQMVSRLGTAIDMPAGPSEVLVFADGGANPAFVAADLLSQAEHGFDSQVVLVSTNNQFIEAVLHELDRQLEQLPRKDIAKVALSNSLAIPFNNEAVAMDFINTYGPEHLILATRDADRHAEQVINAGSVFIGDFTPESAGDYASGTNHTLPTDGWARSTSGVSLDSFVKKITFQKITRKGLQKLGPKVEIMAEAEHLHAHKAAVTVRLEHIKGEGSN